VTTESTLKPFEVSVIESGILQMRDKS
jgi:hypothetical protein